MGSCLMSGSASSTRFGLNKRLTKKAALPDVFSIWRSTASRLKAAGF